MAGCDSNVRPWQHIQQLNIKRLQISIVCWQAWCTSRSLQGTLHNLFSEFGEICTALGILKVKPFETGAKANGHLVAHKTPCLSSLLLSACVAPACAAQTFPGFTTRKQPCQAKAQRAFQAQGRVPRARWETKRVTRRSLCLVQPVQGCSSQ